MRRKIQYEDVCKIGLTGAIMQGDFLSDGSEEGFDEYVRSSMIATLIMNAPTILCNPETGKVEQFKPDKLQTAYKCQYRLNALASGETKVFKVHIPKIYDTDTFAGIMVPDTFWWIGPEVYNLIISCYDNPEGTGDNLVIQNSNLIVRPVGDSVYIRVHNPTPEDYLQNEEGQDILTFQVMFQSDVQYSWFD